METAYGVPSPILTSVDPEMPRMMSAVLMVGINIGKKIEKISRTEEEEL
jgi:hypothetical protein